MFKRLVLALSKLNETITFEFLESQVHLSTVSVSMAAFSMATLEYGFFQMYSVDTPVCIRIHFKALLSALQTKLHFKLLTKWSMILDIQQCVLRVELVWSNMKSKTAVLNYEQSTAMYAKHPPLELCGLRWSLSPKILVEWIFPTDRTRLARVEWKFRIDKKIRMCFASNLQVSLDIDAENLENYSIEKPIHISFSVLELSELIQMAEAFDFPVSGYISDAGKPLVLQMVGSSYTIKFVVSTIIPNNDETVNDSDEESIPPTPSR